MDGNIFNSKGVHVARVIGPTIFDLKGTKRFDLKKGVHIYGSAATIWQMSTALRSVWTSPRTGYFRLLPD